MALAAATTHAKDPWPMRAVIGVIGLASTLAMLAVSAIMNFRFGYGLATNPADGLLYGALSAGADTLKVVMPFIALWAAREKLRSVFWVSLVVMCVCALYGWAGAAGHFSKNRLETAGEKTLQSDNYKDLRAEKARTEEAMKWLGAHRSVDGVKGDIQGLKAKNMRLWTSSSECVEPSGPVAREFCQRYFTLNAELGNAQQAEKHQARIDEITSKLGKVQGSAASQTEGGDAQAGTLSKLSFGLFSISMIQVILVLLGIACLEIGGGFGPFAVFAYAFNIHLHRLAPPKADEPKSVSTGELVPVVEPLAEPPLQIAPPVAKPMEIKTVPVPASLPEPAPEWRTMLADLGYFCPRKGALREPIDRKVLGYHWLTWLYAFGRTGTFTSEQVERMYEEFLLASWRESGTGVNIAKGELHAAALKLDKRAIERDKKSNWTITIKSPKRMRELLLKRDIISAKAVKEVAASVDPKLEKEATAGSVLPFPTAIVSGAGSVAEPANDDTPAATEVARVPVRGRAEMQPRIVPNLEAMRVQARMEKTAMRSKGHALRPQHLHRFSRARAA